MAPALSTAWEAWRRGVATAQGARARALARWRDARASSRAARALTVAALRWRSVREDLAWRWFLWRHRHVDPRLEAIAWRLHRGASALAGAASRARRGLWSRLEGPASRLAEAMRRLAQAAHQRRVDRFERLRSRFGPAVDRARALAEDVEGRVGEENWARARGGVMVLAVVALGLGLGALLRRGTGVSPGCPPPSQGEVEMARLFVVGS